MNQIVSAILFLTLALFLGCRATLQENATVDNVNLTNSAFRYCAVKSKFNGRVVAITSLGAVPSDDAARFERGRIWRRPSRIGGDRALMRGDGHGRGSATLLATLCQICRKNNKERCLRRFCSVRRRTRGYSFEVVCS